MHGSGPGLKSGGFVGAAVLAVLMLAGSAGALGAETREIRMGKGVGIPFLPLAVMKEKRLIETRARADGLGEVQVSWTQLGTGAAISEALLTGNIDISSGGLGPFITLWARTKGNLDVKGVAAASSIPFSLTTTNPAIKSIRDFTARDRIAVPAIKVSAQAILLQMAAEQALGPGKHDALDYLTVSMAPPDAHAALMSGGTEITANFTGPPFMYQQLDSGKARRILTSYDILGGPANFIVLSTTGRFHDANPRMLAAVLAALEEANAFIAAQPRAAAEIYIRDENSRLSVDFVERMIRDAETVFTTTPQGIEKFAAFMHRIGSIREPPLSWKDLFFAEIHAAPGN